MSSSRLDVRSDWEAVRVHLPCNYRELADELKQVQVQYGNAKLRTADDLLRLMLLHVGTDLPLRQTVALMAEAGGPELSHVRLHKKMCRAVPYLKSLVSAMVDTSAHQPEHWAGYDVVSVDASTVCGPGAEMTDARLHVQLRLADLELVSARVDGVLVGESFKRFGWKPGQLAVADRGYCNAPGIGTVIASGADVLVRLNRGSLPLSDQAGKTVELLEWLRGLRGHEAQERVVLVHDRERKCTIRGRLVAMHLPKAAAAKARARIKREFGSKATALDYEVAAYVVLFTTVPKERLDAKRCLALYRLRWQVELLFKRWKSLCGFDRLPNYLDDTILAWLYAKLLLALLMQRMAASALSPPALSPLRALQADATRRRADDAAAVETHLPALAGPRQRPAPASVA